MKITKMANGKSKIKISRKEWEAIGKKAQWEPEVFNEEGMGFATETLPKELDILEEVDADADSQADSLTVNVDVQNLPLEDREDFEGGVAEAINGFLASHNLQGNVTGEGWNNQNISSSAEDLVEKL